MILREQVRTGDWTKSRGNAASVAGTRSWNVWGQ